MKIAHRTIREQITDVRYEGTATAAGFAAIEPAWRLPRLSRYVGTHRPQQAPEVGLTILRPASAS